MTDEHRFTADDLAAARHALSDEGRPEAVTRQHERGKMTARERIASLLDDGSEVEYGAFVTPADPEVERGIHAPAEGLVTCIGSIDGRPVTVVAIDFTVFGGSNGNVGVSKLQRMAALSLHRGIPHVMLLDGGGHRMQEMDSREFATGGPSAFKEQAMMSGWTPQVAAIMGPAFAGPAAQAMFADFVPIVKGTGAIGIAGRTLVKAATGEDLTTEELAGSEVQSRNGAVDMECADDKACLEAVREFLSFLPANAQASVPLRSIGDAPDRRCPDLRDVVPANRRRAYDVRTVLREVVDDGHVFELRPAYGRNVVTGLARIGGLPVGLVANQPMHLAGALDGAACDKITRFVSMCDAYGLPLVTFIDSPGMLIGSVAESQGLARRATRLLMALGHATVPIVSVVLRKCYGLAYLALAGGRSWDAEACFIWPSAEVCPMSIEGAVDQAFRRDWEAADDPQARREELIAEHYDRTTPLRAASGFGIDDIIDPADTRARVATVLQLNAGRRLATFPPKHHRVDP